MEDFNLTDIKPPLGIVPERFYRKRFFILYGDQTEKEIIPLRIEDLKGGIKRYLDADYPVPSEWIKEYNRLIDA